MLHTHEVMSDWLNIFDYVCRRGKVGEENGIRFVIHTKEEGHCAPHLHASYQGKEVTLGIPDGDIISGNLPASKCKLAQKWVCAHQDYLKEKWNTLVNGAHLVF